MNRHDNGNLSIYHSGQIFWYVSIFIVLQTPVLMSVRFGTEVGVALTETMLCKIWLRQFLILNYITLEILYTCCIRHNKAKLGSTFIIIQLMPLNPSTAMILAATVKDVQPAF